MRGRVRTRGWGHCNVALWPWPPFPGRMLRVGGVAVYVCCHTVSAPESWAIPGAWGLMKDTAIHSPLGSKREKKSASNDQLKMYWKKYLSLQKNVKYLRTSPIRNIQNIYGKTNENLLKPIKSTRYIENKQLYTVFEHGKIQYSWSLNSMGLNCVGPLICRFFSINACYGTTLSLVGWICECRIMDMQVWL